MFGELIFHPYDDILISAAAVVAAAGVVYHQLIRPVARAAKHEAEMRDWLHDQFDGRNGQGRLRDQVDRIETQLAEINRRLEEQEK